MNTVIIDGLSFALPLFIMAIGGIYSEKSGITNLAIEGLQGFGAFTGALAAVLVAGSFSGNSVMPFYIAMLFAVIGGTLFSLIHALLCIRFKANMVISGVVINILAMAMTSFLTKQINAAVFGAAQRCSHGIQLVSFIFCKAACIQGITDLRHHGIIKIQIVEYTKTHAQHLLRF